MMGGIIISLIGGAYYDIKDDFKTAAAERKEIRSELKKEIDQLDDKVDNFAGKAIATSGHVSAIVERVDKNERAIEKLRDK